MDIALFAYKQSGKTTVANHLINTGAYERLSLADAVKEDCIEMLNFMVDREGADRITREVLERYKEQTFRPLLQWYGTDFWRNFMERDTYWIDRFVETAVTYENNVVCDDLRFPNEAEALHREGFFLIKIERPDQDHSDAHESEQYIDKIHGDTVIINDGTVDDLCNAVDKVIEMYHSYLPTEASGAQRIIVPDGTDWVVGYDYEDGMKTISIEAPGLDEPAIVLEKHYPMLAHFATQLQDQGQEHHMLDVLKRYNPENSIIEEDEEA